LGGGGGGGTAHDTRDEQGQNTACRVRRESTRHALSGVVYKEDIHLKGQGKVHVNVCMYCVNAGVENGKCTWYV